MIQFVIFLTEIKTSPGFVLKGCKCVRNGLHKTGKGFSARKDLTRRVGKQKDCEFSWQLEACDEGQFNSFVKYLITNLSRWLDAVFANLFELPIKNLDFSKKRSYCKRSHEM